jgi:hypothetical protein
VDNPFRTVFRPEWLNCQGDRIFRIQMVVEAKGMRWTGPKSNPVIVKCTNQGSVEVQMEVKFTNLHLSHVSDSSDDILEAYGSLSVVYRYNIGTSLELTKGSCEGGGSNYCFTNLGNGIFSFAQFYLCHSISPNDCPQGGPINQSGYQTNNNSLVVPVRAGDALRIQVNLWDYDDQFIEMQHTSYIDSFCNGILWTPDKTLLEWASTENEVYHLHQPDNGDAECTVDVVLNAVNQ